MQGGSDSLLTQTSRDFIDNKENSMNFHAAATGMGFLDKVLRPRYSWILPGSDNYDQARHMELLDQFCQMIFALHQEGKFNLLPRGVRDATELRQRIESSLQDRDSLFVSNEYFNNGRRVAATFSTYDVFLLVLAALSDDEAYRHLYQLPDQQQLFDQDRVARFFTLAVALFEKTGLGITGRCNQGARLTLLGVLNGVYPDPAGGYWIFVEDVISNIQSLTVDLVTQSVSRASARSLFISQDRLKQSSGGVQTEIEIPLSDYAALMEFRVNGGSFTDDFPKPYWIDDLKQWILERLESWANEHFLSFEEVKKEIEASGFNYETLIVQGMIEQAKDVALFQTWEDLSARTFNPSASGKWLRSVAGCAQVIDSVLTWVNQSSLVQSSIPNNLLDEQIASLVNLDRLLILDPTVDCMARLNDALNPYNAELGPKLTAWRSDLSAEKQKLSDLFAQTESIEGFWEISTEDFSAVTNKIADAVAAFQDGYAAELMLWLAISLPQEHPLREIAIDGFSAAIEIPGLFTGLLYEDSKLMLEYLKRKNTDVLSIALQETNYAITMYLIAGAARAHELTDGVLTDKVALPGLLGQIEERGGDQQTVLHKNASEYSMQEVIYILLDAAKAQSLAGFIAPIFKRFGHRRDFYSALVDALVHLIRQKRPKEQLLDVVWQFVKFMQDHRMNVADFANTLTRGDFQAEESEALVDILQQLITREDLNDKNLAILVGTLIHTGSCDLELIQNALRRVDSNVLVDALFRQYRENYQYTSLEHAYCTSIASKLAYMHSNSIDMAPLLKRLSGSFGYNIGREYVELAAILMQLNKHYPDCFAAVVDQLITLNTNFFRLGTGFRSMIAQGANNGFVMSREVYSTYVALLMQMMNKEPKLAKSFLDYSTECDDESDDGAELLASMLAQTRQEHPEWTTVLLRLELNNEDFLENGFFGLIRGLVKEARTLDNVGNVSEIVAEILSWPYRKYNYALDALSVFSKPKNHRLFAEVLMHLADQNTRKNQEFFEALVKQSRGSLLELLLQIGKQHPEKLGGVLQAFSRVDGFDLGVVVKSLMQMLLKRQSAEYEQAAHVALVGVLALADPQLLNDKLMPILQESCTNAVQLANFLIQTVQCNEPYPTRQGAYAALAFILRQLKPASAREQFDAVTHDLFGAAKSGSSALAGTLAALCSVDLAYSQHILNQLIQPNDYDATAQILVQVAVHSPKLLYTALNYAEQKQIGGAVLADILIKTLGQNKDQGAEFERGTYRVLAALLERMAKKNDVWASINLDKLLRQLLKLDEAHETFARVLGQMANFYLDQLGAAIQPLMTQKDGLVTLSKICLSLVNLQDYVALSGVAANLMRAKKLNFVQNEVIERLITAQAYDALAGVLVGLIQPRNLNLGLVQDGINSILKQLLSVGGNCEFFTKILSRAASGYPDRVGPLIQQLISQSDGLATLSKICLTFTQASDYAALSGVLASLIPERMDIFQGIFNDVSEAINANANELANIILQRNGQSGNLLMNAVLHNCFDTALEMVRILSRADNDQLLEAISHPYDFDGKTTVRDLLIAGGEKSKDCGRILDIIGAYEEDLYSDISGWKR